MVQFTEERKCRHAFLRIFNGNFTQLTFPFFHIKSELVHAEMLGNKMIIISSPNNSINFAIII